MISPPLHHVGIVQPSEKATAALMDLLQLEEDYRGYVPTWQALCIFTKRETGSPIEFVIPDGGALVKFNGGLGGLHHLALQVPDLSRLTQRLRDQGMSLIESEPVKGRGRFFYAIF